MKDQKRRFLFALAVGRIPDVATRRGDISFPHAESSFPGASSWLSTRKPAEILPPRRSRTGRGQGNIIQGTGGGKPNLPPSRPRPGRRLDFSQDDDMRNS